MNKPKRIANKFLPWIEARKKHRLTHMQVQMARELGLNPRRIGGYAGNEKDPDRPSVGEVIETLFVKRFRKAKPDSVQTIEQLAEAHEEKRAERIATKRTESAAASNDLPDPDPSAQLDAHTND